MENKDVKEVQELLENEDDVEETIENEDSIENNEETTEEPDSDDDNSVKEDITGDGKLPFPRATITKIVRRNITPGKQIKGTVEAIGPYENIQGLNEERGELLKKIKIIKDECDTIINYIDESNKLKVGALSTEEEKLPFPKATITNKLRQELDEGKTIKGPVKKGLNIWLGKVVARVSKKMDTYPYAYIDRSMFKDSIETYEAVGEIELEKERIIQQMESMKTSCDLLVMEVEHKFKI